MQLQAQARVRELHREAQARDMQEKQERKEQRKRKKAEEEQNTGEPSMPVKPEDEKMPPVPAAKKLKKTQGVIYASAAMEEFFTSPATTAPDVQNPEFKFVTIFLV